MGTGFVSVPLGGDGDKEGSDRTVVVFQADDGALVAERGRRRPKKLEEDAVGQLQAIAEAAELGHESLRERLQPGTVELEISVGLSAQVGWFVAKSTADGSLKLKFTWDTSASGQEYPGSGNDAG